MEAGEMMDEGAEDEGLEALLHTVTHMGSAHVGYHIHRMQL